MTWVVEDRVNISHQSLLVMRPVEQQMKTYYITVIKIYNYYYS
jgi:hypothetical protein